MIKVTFYYNNNKLSGFKLQGHANFNTYGNDIVCAAVSALSINTLNCLKKLAHVNPVINMNKVDGGFLYVRINDLKDINNQRVIILLNSLQIGLEDISKNYKKNLRIYFRKEM